MISSKRTALLLLLLTTMATMSSAFTSPLQSAAAATKSTALRESWDGVNMGDKSARGGGSGSIEQIEFKIYPDGRVEETVRGVKGGNCHTVTEKINEALGKVIASAPTEELYEQEVVIDQTLTQTEGTGSSWDGSTPSSW